MRKLAALLLFSISFSLAGQKAAEKLRIVKDLQQIDSLFRIVYSYADNTHIKIDYRKNELKFLFFSHEDRNRIYYDSLVGSATADSAAIWDKCTKVKAPFSVIYPLLCLMVKNKFTYLTPAGPGDCIDCCILVYSGSRKAYFVKQTKNRCMPDHCYYRNGSKRTRFRQLAKNIQIIKKPGVPEIFQ